MTKAQANIRERSQGNLAQILTNAYAKDFPQREPALTFLYQQISTLNVHVAPNLVQNLFGLKYSIQPLVEHKIPTLLLVGEKDVLTPPHAMESVAAHIPHSRFLKISDAGHSAYFERAGEFNRLVQEFLRSAIR